MNKAFLEFAKADAAAVFGPDGEFSEEIIYTPRDNGRPRRITGIVDRDDAIDRQGIVQARGIALTVRVPNHPTRGIEASEIDTGDKITLKVNGVDDVERMISTLDNAGVPLVTWDALEVVIRLS